MNTPDDDNNSDPRFVDLLTGFDAALADDGPGVGWDAPTLPHDLRAPFEQARDCLVLLARVWPRPELPPSPAPLPERLGRFRTERLLGRGSFGTVYRATDPATGGPLALKLLHRATPDGIGRFKQEFRTLANVAHHNLVTLHELIGVDGCWLIAMELVEGTDFRSHIRSRPTDWDHLRSTLRQLALGVDALHGAGVLHRDLKPQNVLVTHAGEVKVVDCGLATYLAAQDGRPTYLAGTAGYMSPEQAACLPLSPASDWYSVGVMLYEVLAGALPFAGTVSEVLRGKRAHAAPPAALPGVPGDLAGLCKDLLRREPADRPTGADVLRRLGSTAPVAAAGENAPGSSSTTAFVGRLPELARLYDSFQHVRGQGARVICVHGPSGIGKSTLVEHFLGQLRAREGAVTLVGRCHERESMPFKAFDSIIDAVVEHLEGRAAVTVAALLPADVGLLARLFPTLRTVGDVEARVAATPHVLDPVEFRRRAFRALRDLLGRLARESPLVVVIDDLQWGDEDSGRLLADILAPPDPPPLLLLGCYRSDAAATSDFVRSLEGAAAALGGGLDVTRLEVGPLPEADGRELAAALLGEGSSPDRVSQIARESEGMPIFLEQLAQSVGRGPSPGLGRDVSLGTIIRHRVERLPPEALALLETVAIAGRPVRQQDAYGAAGVGLLRRDALTALRAGQFVRTTGPGIDDMVDTYHSRIRDAVFAGLTPEAVRQHHLNLAGTLRGCEQADPEAVSDHFLAGGEPAPAAEFAEKAADQAAEAVAFDRAARLVVLHISSLSPGPKGFPGPSEVVHALDPEPHGLRSGWICSLRAVHVPTQLSNQSNHLR